MNGIINRLITLLRKLQLNRSLVFWFGLICSFASCQSGGGAGEAEGLFWVIGTEMKHGWVGSLSAVAEKWLVPRLP